MLPSLTLWNCCFSWWGCLSRKIRSVHSVWKWSLFKTHPSIHPSIWYGIGRCILKMPSSWLESGHLKFDVLLGFYSLLWLFRNFSDDARQLHYYCVWWLFNLISFKQLRIGNRWVSWCLRWIQRVHIYELYHFRGPWMQLHSLGAGFRKAQSESWFP